MTKLSHDFTSLPLAFLTQEPSQIAGQHIHPLLSQQLFQRDEVETVLGQVGTRQLVY